MHLKSEAQLRADYGDAAAAYAVRARRVCERIDAFLAREQDAYVAAVKGRRLSTAAHIRAMVDPWIVRQAHIRFNVDLMLGRAYMARRHNVGTLFVVHANG